MPQIPSIQHNNKTNSITVDVGHSDAILSFDLSNHHDAQQILCTSSYDHSIQLYDLHHKQNISQIRPNNNSGLDISHVKLYTPSLLQHGFIYAIIGNCIHIYDLRNISQELFILKCFDDQENELNSLDMVGENACTCDDDGNIYIFSNQLNGSELKIKKVLKNVHENICMNVKLRPNTSCEVISGGLDQKYIHQNWKSNNVLFKGDSTQWVPSFKTSQQVINPPYIHSLDINKRDSRSVIGLGNGSIVMFDLSAQHSKFVAFNNAHSYIVNNIQFMNDQLYSDHFMSASLDGIINIWKYESKGPLKPASKKISQSLLPIVWNVNTGNKIECAKYSNGYVYVSYENGTTIDKISMTH
ncbi:hypothetical protein C9374_008131 [Naegleria lovaniensis]|uniref:Uncharacterized protein n=1 Tax=Naegleria lovaniensis TaxID=51637 RepID=A0AA88KFN8_NAELO|nr:uncharacterized protein C9374_008131 [Naegleria lovaniensis]KAG2378492.1 hypothetical protein C9374_008131 [Naegleria lovaniensis]